MVAVNLTSNLQEARVGNVRRIYSSNPYFISYEEDIGSTYLGGPPVGQASTMFESIAPVYINRENEIRPLGGGYLIYLKANVTSGNPDWLKLSVGSGYIKTGEDFSTFLSYEGNTKVAYAVNFFVGFPAEDEPDYTRHFLFWDARCGREDESITAEFVLGFASQAILDYPNWRERLGL